MTSRVLGPLLAAVWDPGGGMLGDTEPALDSNLCRASDGSDKPNSAKT
jgi:hypothetical protein